EVPADPGPVVGTVRRLLDHLTYEPENAGLVRTLLGRAVVVRDLTAARALAETGFSGDIVTEAGDVLFADGTLAGGGADEVAEGILGARREIRELSGAVARLVGECTDRSLRRAQVACDLEQDRARVDALAEHGRRSELDWVEWEKDLERTAGEETTIRERLDALGAEAAGLAGVIADTEREEEAARAVVTQSTVERTDAEVGLDALQRP